MSEKGLGRAKPLSEGASAPEPDSRGCLSGYDRGDQRPDPDGIHDPRQIMGEHREGHLGDIERHCTTSIGPLDGWVVGPLSLDGEPGNQPEWRL